jgi:hypothetical protein
MKRAPTDEKSATTKMTVKVYRPLMEKFNHQVRELHLVRDAFLDSMIRRETSALAHDLVGKKQSPAARLHVARSLKRMGTTQVNLKVQKSTVEALDKVVAESNMVRDAFINRLIMFLRSSDVLLNFLELPKVVVNSEFKSFVEAMPTSPLGAIQAVHWDPLYYIRVAIEERHKTGLYTVLMPPKLTGFSCYLEDAYVPGTESYAQAQREFEELFGELDNFEKDAFATPASKDEKK